MNKIAVTFLVSYDSHLLRTSIPLVYDWADLVVFSIDRERRTWQGNEFALTSDFFEWIKKIDSRRKIVVYEDTFFVEGKPPMELDCRQRQMTADHIGMDDTWHIQVDSDEYVLNFEKLIADLRQEEIRREDCRGVLYMGKWIPLFKQDAGGFFYVDNHKSSELVALAAFHPHYLAARKTSCTTQSVLDVQVVHQTFARPEAELLTKFQNWSHSNDFNVESYLKLWRAVDRNNYFYLANFHPTYKPTWERLAYIEAASIEDFIDHYRMRSESPREGGVKDTMVRNDFRKTLRRLLKRLVSPLLRLK